MPDWAIKAMSPVHILVAANLRNYSRKQTIIQGGILDSFFLPRTIYRWKTIVHAFSIMPGHGLAFLWCLHAYPFHPKCLNMLLTLSLGFSGSSALLELAPGTVVMAVVVLPSRGELPRMLSWHCDWHKCSLTKTKAYLAGLYNKLFLVYS